MLILTRNLGEKIFIGNEIIITILKINKNNIKIGINAPKNISINKKNI